MQRGDKHMKNLRRETVFKNRRVCMDNIEIDLIWTESKFMVSIFFGSLHGTVVISFEHKNKLTNSIKDGNFPDKLPEHRLLNKDFVLWS